MSCIVTDFNKKIFLFFVFLVVFIFPYKIYAIDIVDSGSVIVTARVIDPNTVITNPNPGGSVYIPKIAVSFSGEAYPHATVAVLKAGSEVVTVSADASGYFNATLEEKYDSTVLYTLYAKDVSGTRSLLLNYPIAVYTGYLTELKNIRFAPTVSLDKAEVAYGDYLSVFGYALPDKDIQIYIDGITKRNFQVHSSYAGVYRITAPLDGLPKGDYILSVKYNNDDRASKLLKFLIGDFNKLIKEESSELLGDCNKDNLINLIDFSVLAFWYKKINPPVCVDVNKDNTVNLIDFSILAFYWTG